jgi:hypothetical protein
MGYVWRWCATPLRPRRPIAVSYLANMTTSDDTKRWEAECYRVAGQVVVPHRDGLTRSAAGYAFNIATTAKLLLMAAHA